ncbi:hypothetical protein [Streptomyces sp. RKAG337]|uniref:hypothetical protein n=1 Tax=Streptomyces sp. RKAG337 TaxID=2893404 RepID=UPI002033DE79|nr:hypothetical protein [Streptomyces sp. RKAG337]MCM2426782.1 hypothetical protein [Streptomyces sp. RKAG337]
MSTVETDTVKALSATSTLRQRVLVLYLTTSALDSEVVGWSAYDGTGATSPTTGDGDEPPYGTGVAALCDGWRLFQAAQLIPPYPGHEYDTSFLKHEFFFEKLVDTVDTIGQGG